jgi:hypothetical protein
LAHGQRVGQGLGPLTSAFVLEVGEIGALIGGLQGARVVFVRTVKTASGARAVQIV